MPRCLLGHHTLLPNHRSHTCHIRVYTYTYNTWEELHRGSNLLKSIRNLCFGEGIQSSFLQPKGTPLNPLFTVYMLFFAHKYLHVVIRIDFGVRTSQWNLLSVLVLFSQTARLQFSLCVDDKLNR